MKKSGLKFVTSGIALCAIVVLLLSWIDEVLVSKTHNRYYMLEQILESRDEDYDVQIYGSCHSYTSFNALYFEENYGLTAFDMGNAGEIMPTTYLRMAERFKTDAPKVAVVEIWGINPYETYDSMENIFEGYMPVNVERLPLSLRKLEVIRDFDCLSEQTELLAVTKYKDRIMDGELAEYDFDYAFMKVYPLTSDYICEEMFQRSMKNGFEIMPNWVNDPEAYTPYLAVTDYYERQAVVGDDEVLELEPDIAKYVDKIIDLCEEHDVELIFYRAPYISTENELRKANWFAKHCEEKGVLYIDTEKALTFDVETDFNDYYHVNDCGAQKITEHLAPYILAVAQ